MAGAINLVLMGRSGAGKSSLANYMYGKDLFKTGEGAPVTEFGKKWDRATITDSAENFDINVYDSPGLEPDNYPKWKDDFERNMRDREAPDKWIHGAFYVINAASGRIEPTEIDVIRRFPQEYVFPISVVLTNCDSASKEQIEEIKNVIRSTLPHIRINEVCSVERKKRGGKIVSKFGRENLLNDHAHKVAFYFINRVGINLFGKDAPRCVNNMLGKLISKIKDSDFGLIKLIKYGESSLDYFITDITNNLEEYMEQQVEYLAQAVDDARAYLDQISDECFYLPDPMQVMEEIDIDKERATIAPLIDDIINAFEDGSAWDKFTGIFKTGYVLITIKDQFADAIDIFRRMLLLKLREKEDICRKRLANPEKYLDEELTFFEW